MVAVMQERQHMTFDLSPRVVQAKGRRWPPAVAFLGV